METNENAMRVTCYHEVTINAPAQTIFPLACPKEELKWIDAWEYDLIYSESGYNENNCIFVERMSSPVLFETPGDTLWHTTLHNRDDLKIQFLLNCAGKALIKWNIAIYPIGPEISRVAWNLTLTSLSDDVDRIGRQALEERLAGIIGFLSQSLKHYCEQGSILKLT
jgi:hypothetical protein